MSRERFVRRIEICNDEKEIEGAGMSDGKNTFSDFF